MTTIGELEIRIAELIPGSWFVQMNGGGHGLMYQYPEQHMSPSTETILDTNC